MRSRDDSRFYHGNFSLQGKIPVVTTVWVVSRFRLKARPGISSSSISPLTSSGQRSRASWASQPQKSATLSPQPGGKTTKVHKNMWWHWGGIYIYIQGVPLPTKPSSSLIIPKPMKILQRDLNRSTFVV